MSYDISFRVKVDGIDRYVDVGDCTANITWNVRKIIELSTGLPWLNEENNGLCIDVIPKIIDGWSELKKHPEKYKSLVVRVAGYSALFTTLSKGLQEDIINRTEQQGF